jgi:NADPH2:quinone reductase
VVAAAGGERKLELAAELGAGLTVDYTEPDWTQAIKGQLGGVDVAFDGVGGEIGRAAFDLLRPGARFSVFGLASGQFTAIPDEEAARRGISVIRGSRVAPEEMLEFTRAALAEAAAGRLQPVVGQTFPLDRAADAHTAIEARATIGKTLLLTR